MNGNPNDSGYILFLHRSEKLVDFHFRKVKVQQHDLVSCV